MSILKKSLFLLVISLLLTACGYRPSAYYAKKEMDGNVFVKLNVRLEDPKNSVLVKDAMNKILIQRLDSRIVSDEKLADVKMDLSISSIGFSVLQYDNAGYNKLYKAVVVVKVDYTRVDNEVKKSFTVEGEHDFSVDDGTTITESKRYDAIVNASNKAVDEILSRIAVASFR